MVCTSFLFIVSISVHLDEDLDIVKCTLCCFKVREKNHSYMSNLITVAIFYL